MKEIHSCSLLIDEIFIFLMAFLANDLSSNLVNLNTLARWVDLDIWHRC